MTDWLLANPNAGSGERNAEFWQSRLADAGLDDVRLCDLDEQGWVGKVRAGDRILAAGGDGSVNRAASLCLKTGATLAVLPSGTANDFFRNLGLPEDPAELCEAVAEGRTRDLDIADFSNGIFLNVAHVGLGTLASRDSEGGVKKLFGRFSYGLSLIRRLYSQRGFRGTVYAEQAAISGRWLTIAIANGTFFGGGNEIPGASLNNGKLVIIAVRPDSVPSLFWAYLTARLRGSTSKGNKTVVELVSPWCRVDTRRPRTVTVDGEVAGKTPLNVLCQARGLRVVCGPRSSTE